MEKLKFNPNNKKYYSEEFIKGFECGVERQYEADMKEDTAEWIIHKDTIGVTNEILHIFECSGCGKCVTEQSRYCPNCGRHIVEK